jgi:drug/metabolite transporter (DMT)-like permease
MSIAKRFAKEVGAVGLALFVVVLCFIASYAIVSYALPEIASSVDEGYPFAALMMTFLLGLGFSVLALGAISHPSLRKSR